MTPDLAIVFAIVIGAGVVCLLLMEREDWRSLAWAIRVAPRWYAMQLQRYKVRVRFERSTRRDACASRVGERGIRDSHSARCSFESAQRFTVADQRRLRQLVAPKGLSPETRNRFRMLAESLQEPDHYRGTQLTAVVPCPGKGRMQ